MKVSTGIRGRRYFYSWPEMNALSRTKSRDPSAHDVTHFNFDGKTFSDILPRSSADALWMMKRNKVETVNICGWAKSTSEEME